MRGGVHAFCVRDQKIVAHHLNAVANGGGEAAETFRVVFGERVLD